MKQKILKMIHLAILITKLSRNKTLQKYQFQMILIKKDYNHLVKQMVQDQIEVFIHLKYVILTIIKVIAKMLKVILKLAMKIIKNSFLKKMKLMNVKKI